MQLQPGANHGWTRRIQTHTCLQNQFCDLSKFDKKLLGEVRSKTPKAPIKLVKHFTNAMI